MSAATQVYEDPDDVDARLVTLGLRREELQEAVRFGYLARLSCNANDPPAFAGITFWARTTRGLREQLGPRGWRKDDSKLAAVVNADRTVALVVMTGNGDTGLPTGAPKSKFAKGPATVEAVDVNVQGELFPLSEVLRESPTTWVLLVSIELRDDKIVVRSELSRPSELDETGRVGDWYERIVLPAIEDDYDRGGRQREPEPGPEFDVDVRRLIG